MLHPSYSELIDVLNQDADVDHQITSRYSIVIAVSKRARQLVDNAPRLTDYDESGKAVSIAVNEMYNKAIKVKISKSEDELSMDETIGSMSGVIGAGPAIIFDEGELSEYEQSLKSANTKPIEVYDNDLAEDNLYDDNDNLDGVSEEETEDEK